ncbi:MAG: squalene synthase HpnC [Solirubrobacterales bacterium]
MPAVTEADAASAPSAAAVMARASHENFPVASRLLPAREREHLRAIYGYARLVDDIGDEAPGDRGALLDWVEGELDAIYGAPGAGHAAGGPDPARAGPVAGEPGRPEHPVMRRLAVTVRACAIPRDPLDRLVAANRADQVVSRYEDFAALLRYCDLSAAPVGELVLHVFGCATPERIALSDRVCAGLQVTEHLQDVAEDLAAGRIYLPVADLDACGCTEAHLRAPAPGPQLRAVMALEAARARELLAAGIPLGRSLPARPAFAVAGFVAGGRAALGALERAGWDVLGHRPRPAKATIALGTLRALAKMRR